MKDFAQIILLLIVSLTVVAIATFKTFILLCNLILSILSFLALAIDFIIVKSYDLTVGNVIKFLSWASAAIVGVFVLANKEYLTLQQSYIFTTAATLSFLSLFACHIKEVFYPKGKPSPDERSLRNIYYEEETTINSETIDLELETEDIFYAPKAIQAQSIIPPFSKIFPKTITSFEKVIAQNLRLELTQNINTVQRTIVVATYPKLPQKLNALSVRQLQTLCDRINKVAPKTITQYRTKRTNKRGIVRKIQQAYSIA